MLILLYMARHSIARAIVYGNWSNCRSAYERASEKLSAQKWFKKECQNSGAFSYRAEIESGCSLEIELWSRPITLIILRSLHVPLEASLYPSRPLFVNLTSRIWLGWENTRRAYSPILVPGPASQPARPQWLNSWSYSPSLMLSLPGVLGAPLINGADSWRTREDLIIWYQTRVLPYSTLIASCTKK